MAEPNDPTAAFDQLMDKLAAQSPAPADAPSPAAPADAPPVAPAQGGIEQTGESPLKLQGGVKQDVVNLDANKNDPGKTDTKPKENDPAKDKADKHDTDTNPKSGGQSCPNPQSNAKKKLPTKLPGLPKFKGKSQQPKAAPSNKTTPKKGGVSTTAPNNVPQKPVEQKPTLAPVDPGKKTTPKLGKADCTKLKDQINKLTDAVPRANLAADVYDVYDPTKKPGTPLPPNPPGFTRISDNPDTMRKLFKGRLTDQQIKDLTHPDNSTYRASIYQDATGKTYLVFRGTENKAGMGDWKANGEQGVGAQNADYEKAKQLATYLSQSVGTNNMEIVGHSKGGGMAAAAGIVTDARTTTFNASGVHPNTVPGHNLAEANRNVTSYVVDGEILNYLQDHPQVVHFAAAVGVAGNYGPIAGAITWVLAKDTLPTSVGNRTALPGGIPPGRNLLEQIGDRVNLHGMDTVKKSIQKQLQQHRQEFRDGGCQ